jgi:catechol 2,3-dioxygenase-like lactoylglutathione lyase family enzyme
MNDSLAVVELKAFVPALDMDASKRFYTDMGFRMASDDGDVAYFVFGDVSFLLQGYDVHPSEPQHMEMHLLVESVDAWHRHLLAADLVDTYGVTVTDIVQQPWRMRDFTITDPSGVTWRIAQNTD